MPKKRYKPEEIVAKLRQVDVLVSQGQNIADAIRQIGVSEVAYAMNCSMAKSSTRCVQIVIESWRRHFNAIRP
jgi:hypothetical protein